MRISIGDYVEIAAGAPARASGQYGSVIAFSPTGSAIIEAPDHYIYVVTIAQVIILQRDTPVLMGVVGNFQETD